MTEDTITDIVIGGRSKPDGYRWKKWEGCYGNMQYKVMIKILKLMPGLIGSIVRALDDVNGDHIADILSC